MGNFYSASKNPTIDQQSNSCATHEKKEIQEPTEDEYEIITEISYTERHAETVCTEDFINTLPPEMLLEIFRHLGAKTVFLCFSVCTKWNRILLDERLDESFWKPICLREVQKISSKDELGKIIVERGVINMSSSWRYACNMELQHHGLANIIKTCNTFLKTHISSTSSLFLDMKNLTLLPECVFDQTKLGKLFLSSNKIFNLPPSINKFGSLRELYLSSNLLSNLPEELFAITTLEQLHVRDNYFTEIPEQVSKLTNLRQLGFGYNIIRSVPMCLSSLCKLSLLALSNNEITTDGLEVLSTLTNLVHLQISYNLLEQVPPGIMTLQKLRTLKIQENRIPNLTESYFSSLPQLQDLNV